MLNFVLWAFLPPVASLVLSECARNCAFMNRLLHYSCLSNSFPSRKKLLIFALNGRFLLTQRWCLGRMILIVAHGMAPALVAVCLHGNIPSINSLFFLLHSQNLNLCGNDFNYSKISYGFSQFRSLTILNLRHYNFRGSIPSSFCNLTQLMHLDLSSNILSGHIPSSLSNLEQLRWNSGKFSPTLHNFHFRLLPKWTNWSNSFFYWWSSKFSYYLFVSLLSQWDHPI